MANSLKAKLVRVQMEVGRKWVDGYQVITPQGNPLFPYFRKNAAKKFCREQGWESEVST